MIGAFKGGRSNLGLFTLKKGNQGFLIEAKQAVSGIETKIVIELSGKISEFSWDEKINFQHVGGIALFSAFLGIVSILSEHFLVFVDEVDVVCCIFDKPVFECKSVTLVPMLVTFFIELQMEYIGKADLSRETKQFIERIEKILTFGHYFAFDYPLTLSQQKQAQIAIKKPNVQIGCQFEAQYFWNKSMLKPLMNQGISSKWHVQLIQGFIQDFTTVLKQGLQLKYLLISRRSTNRSGTRCNHRGADTDGNTANFVEHESIYFFNQTEKVISHVQIRGSLPILWEQNGLKGKIRLAGGEQISLQAFKRHFIDVTEHYGKCFSISLMAEGRSGEKLLTSTFKAHYDMAPELHSQVTYDTFDIKANCKGGKYENINPYILKQTALQKTFSYFLLGQQNIQSGVVRTNCKSSLDRTNIFQSKLELNLMQIILKEQFNLTFDQLFGQDALDMMENAKKSVDFMNKFKILWSINGDNISQHYAGTNALTSHATKTGTTGLFGKLRGKLSSIKRLYEGTFQDSHKQEAFDLILGRHIDSQKALLYEEELKQEAFRRESQFLQQKQISVFINTWCLKKTFPKSAQAYLKNILDFQNFKAPNIIVLCFQKKPEFKPEFLEASLQNKTERQFWVELIQHDLFLMDLPNYAEVDFHLADGVMTVVLADKNVLDLITAVEHDDLTSGSTGKGTVIIKMNVADTKLCFINAHLINGQNKAQERIGQLIEIHAKAFQQEGISKYKREKIEKYDKVFLAGNLNFRVNLDFTESLRQISKILELQKQGKIDQSRSALHAYLLMDQFTSYRKGQLSNYMEGQITFLPTYKCQINRTNFDLQSETVPSWCDRIMMWNNEGNHAMRNQQESEIEIDSDFLPFNTIANDETKNNYYNEGLPLFYSRKDVDTSNHRPVSAYYIVTVREENMKIKEKMLKELVNKKIEITSQQSCIRNEISKSFEEETTDLQRKICGKNQQKVPLQSVAETELMQQEHQEEQEEDDDDDDDDDEDEYEVKNEDGGIQNNNNDNNFILQRGSKNLNQSTNLMSSEYSMEKDPVQNLNSSSILETLKSNETLSNRMSKAVQVTTAIEEDLLKSKTSASSQQRWSEQIKSTSHWDVCSETYNNILPPEIIMMNSRNTAPETSSSVFKRTTSKSVGDDADGDKFDGLAVIKEFNK